MRRQPVGIAGFLCAALACHGAWAQQPAAAQSAPGVNVRVLDLDAALRGQETLIPDAQTIIREGAIANWRPLAFDSGVQPKEEPARMVSIAISAGDQYVQRFVTLLKPGAGAAPERIFLAKRERKVDTLDYAREGQKMFGEEFRRRFGSDAAIAYYYSAFATLDSKDNTALPMMVRFGYARALKDGCIYGGYATCDEAYLIFSGMLDDLDNPERKALLDGANAIVHHRHVRDGLSQLLQYQYVVEMRQYQVTGNAAQAEGGLKLISDSKFVHAGTRAAARYHMTAAQIRQCPATPAKCEAAAKSLQELRGGSYDLQSVGVSGDALDALSGDLRRRQREAAQPVQQ